MTLIEILAAVGLAGFLTAAGLALKSYFATKEATNVWLLFAIGFTLLAAGQAVIIAFYFDSMLGFYKEFARDLQLAGVAIIFCALAVYYKEKRVCGYYCKKKGDGKTLKHAKKFA